MVPLKKEADGSFRLTYQGVGIIIATVLASLGLGVGGIVKSSDRFTGTQAQALESRVLALETTVSEHRDDPCHGEVCVEIGRLTERLDHLQRQHYRKQFENLDPQ